MGVTASGRPSVDFDQQDPALAQILWERIEEFHTKCPVGWSELRGGFWLLSRHEHVWSAAQNWQRYSSADGAAPLQFDLDVFRMIPLETDPPMHRGVRRILNPFFTPEALKRTEPIIDGIVRELLDRCLELSPCDFVKNFTEVLPARVFFESFLGRDDLTDIDWMLEIIATLFVSPEAAFEKIPELGAWCWEVMEARLREGRRDDLVGTIAHAGMDDGLELDDRQRLEVMLMVILAGMETTASGLGNVVLRLATDQQLREQLKTFDTSGVDHAVDELLRLDPPIPAAARTLTEDVELHGCPMRKGERVLLNWAGANRDPEAFPDPGAVDFDRPNIGRHMSFGGGIHHCLGTHLARREIRLAIQAICEFEIFELVPDTAVVYRAGMARGPESLPILCRRER